jgi:hypothetical protein
MAQQPQLLIKAVSSGHQLVVQVVGTDDNVGLAWGEDGDFVIILRSTTLAANTALTDVLIGTPVTPALPANSAILSNVTASGDILVAANDGGNSRMYVHIDSSAQTLALLDGLVFIGDTANTDMTVGLTINQGANDDAILTLKSSDVAHPMTDYAEADTYGEFAKVEGGSGGLFITGYKDAGGYAGFALVLEGSLGEAADTTDTTTSNATLHLRGNVTTGGALKQAVADAGNVMVLENFTTVRLLVKGNGDLHATNITAGSGDLDGIALDAWDDAALVRFRERTLHNDLGIVMSKWDEVIEANDEDLRRAGVLVGDFYSLQRMDSLLGGSIWQATVDIMSVVEAILPMINKEQRALFSPRIENRLRALGAHNNGTTNG